MSPLIYIVLLLVLFHVYFLPEYMLDLLLKGKPIVYKSPHLLIDTPSFLLTFDDSPTPYTNEILDVLHSFHLKAVFFVLSDHIDGNEEILDRIVSEGHVLGNHGTKDAVHAFMDEETFEIDLLECERKLHPWTQHYTGAKLFRPGFAFFNESMFGLLEKHGYTMVLGNVYCYDSYIASSGINAWYVQQKLNHESIVVLHDNQSTPQTLLKLFKKSYLRSS